MDFPCFYRSTSPSTISIEPRTATQSATNQPGSITGRADRFTKVGARTLYRYGRSDPKPLSTGSSSLRFPLLVPFSCWREDILEARLEQ